MPRIARVVIPDCPHHVIQRGNRRQKSFFCDSDKQLYLRLLKRHGERAGISFLAYCLMENHVHLIAIPKTKGSLATGIGEAHRKYTTIINIREDCRGYLWQGRFISYPLDEAYFFAAVRYVERNPVRAGLVKSASDYAWSSARAHVFKKANPLLSDISRFLKVDDWGTYLGEKEENSFIERMKRHESTGRPLGNNNFIINLEKLTGRRLRPRDYHHKRGTEYCVPLFE
ncbi:MAG: transposase [Candidatus Aminicenantes bacterium]|nr:transposase [Candidatus Aminicenantes bacterium]